MTALDEDFSRLVAAEPTHDGPVDVDALIRAGTRARRRRGLAVGIGAAIAVVAVSVPFAVLGGDHRPDGAPPASSDRTGPRPADPGKERSTRAVDPSRPRHDVRCGLFACSVDGEFDGPGDSRKLIGDPLTLGTFEGHDEVVYAMRAEGYDTSTGKPADEPVLVLALGIEVDGRVLRTVWGPQPETDPQQGAIGMYGGDRLEFPDGSLRYGVVGYVEGDQTDITATLDGETRPVTAVSTDVMPGYTVFFDTGAWDESWDRLSEVTITLDDGTSCTPADCSSVG